MAPRRSISISRKFSSGRDNGQAAGQFDLPFATGAIGSWMDAANEALSAAIRASQYSRETLCDIASHLLGRTVNVSTLNAWTAKTNGVRIPADVLVALCMTLGDWQPLQRLLQSTGLELATARDRAYAELGRVQLDREHLAERERAARQTITHGNIHGGSR